MAHPALVQIADWNLPQVDGFITDYQKNPGLFMRDILGLKNIWEGQEKILESIVNNRRVIVPSGHALGKDYISSAIILWFLFCHKPSIVVATAPTDRQVGAVIWGELTEKYHNAKQPLGGRLLDKYLEVDEKNRWYAIGFTTKDVNKSQGKFQGFHSANVLILFSEAQAIERSIWGQAESLMTAGTAKWLAIGNPLVSYGAFYENIQPKSGWDVIRLDCEDSPNVKTGQEIIPGMCSKVWVDEMAAKYGKESPIYLSKVKGIPPTSSDSVPVQREWVEWANTEGMETLSDVGCRIVGYDPAGMGTAKHVFAVRHGAKLHDLKRYSKLNTMEMVGKCVEYINAGYSIRMDATGLGIVIYHRLIELGFGGDPFTGQKCKVFPESFGGKPKDPAIVIPGRRLPTEVFADRISQMYHHLAQVFENRAIACEYDEDLNMQLLSREMKRLSNGKMKLESKDAYRGRGYDSPDEADAVTLAFAEGEEVGPVQEAWAEVQDDKTLGEIFER